MRGGPREGAPNTQLALKVDEGQTDADAEHAAHLPMGEREGGRGGGVNESDHRSRPLSVNLPGRGERGGGRGKFLVGEMVPGGASASPTCNARRARVALERLKRRRGGGGNECVRAGGVHLTGRRRGRGER